MANDRRVVADVPSSQLEFVVAAMEFDGAQVTRQKQASGLWTVTGTFPDQASAAVAEVEEAPAADATFSRDVDTLARTLWGEARGGSPLGMKAVAAVVVNRLHRNKPDRFGASIAEVCLKPRQFSCWNADDTNLPKLKQVTPADRRFAKCLVIAERAVRGELPDPTGGCDHYHTTRARRTGPAASRTCAGSTIICSTTTSRSAAAPRRHASPACRTPGAFSDVNAAPAASTSRIGRGVLLHRAAQRRLLGAVARVVDRGPTRRRWGCRPMACSRCSR